MKSAELAPGLNKEMVQSALQVDLDVIYDIYSPGPGGPVFFTLKPAWRARDWFSNSAVTLALSDDVYRFYDSLDDFSYMTVSAANDPILTTITMYYKKMGVLK